LIAFASYVRKVGPRNDSQISGLDVRKEEMVKGSIEAVVADKEVVEPQKEMVGDPFVQKKFFVPHDSCNAENRVSTAE